MLKNNILKNVELILIKLDADFIVAPYLHWFDMITKQKICSFYQYNDRLIAFTSQLLQKYYLAKLLKINTDKLEIGYTEYHKPFITAPTNLTKKLNFNIAHSKNYVALAVYNGNDNYIGVDIEQINYTFETKEMSPIVFSVIEQQLVGSSKEKFFKLWTKKEALIKALGTGFATDFYQDTQLNLDDFEVNDRFLIITQKFDNYFLSICLHKAINTPE